LLTLADFKGKIAPVTPDKCLRSKDELDGRFDPRAPLRATAQRADRAD
jgi:hypothetical protein